MKMIARRELMTRAAITKLKKLPVTERIVLVDELMESIAADQLDIPVSNDEKAMIDERLAEIAKHPTRGIPFTEFRKELRALSRSMKAGTCRKSA
jgi:putative addiction module component (TIGR02574 family)